MTSDRRCSSPYVATPAGLRLRVRLQPGASRDEIVGVESLSDGAAVLKVKVSAPPEEGKANAALIKLLAKACKRPKGAFSIVAGERQRLKTLEVEGDAGALVESLGL